MPLSGTVPSFDVSTSSEQTPTVVTVTGSVSPASGSATGANSTETLQAFLRRVISGLSISGVVDAAGQTITSGQLSGLAQLQRECALRLTDLEKPAASHGNVARLAHANIALSANGEVQFGS